MFTFKQSECSSHIYAKEKPVCFWDMPVGMTKWHQTSIKWTHEDWWRQLYIAQEHFKCKCNRAHYTILHKSNAKHTAKPDHLISVRLSCIAPAEQSKGRSKQELRVAAVKAQKAASRKKCMLMSMWPSLSLVMHIVYFPQNINHIDLWDMRYICPLYLNHINPLKLRHSTLMLYPLLHFKHNVWENGKKTLIVMNIRMKNKK